MRIRVRHWWRFAIAVVAFGLLVLYVSPAALLVTLQRTDPSWLTAYFGATLLVPVWYGVQILGALRWAGHTIPAAPVLGAAMQAWGIGTLTPARAGDLSLAYFLRGRVPESDAIAVVSMDKLVSLVTLALLALASAVGFALPHGDTLVFGAAIVLCGVAALFVLLSMPSADVYVRAISRGRFGPMIEATWKRMRSLSGSPRALAWCFFMTTLRWLFICGTNLLIFRSIAAHPNFSHVIAATAAGRIISLIPISVGGVGIKEPVQIMIYREVGVPAEAVLAVSVLGLACTFVIAAIAPFLARMVERISTEAV